MASYTLHIQYVDRPAETRTISQPKVMIGRDAGDIVLHDSQVSGRHAEISWDGTTLRFTDLGSTNGSFLLQGQRVANLELTPGIALRLGNSLITVQAIEGNSAAGKGRTMIAGPGMVPGFPAPMKNPAPPPSGGLRPPGPPAPGGLAFAPTAQMQPPSGLRPPQPGGPFAPAPPQPGGFAGPPPPQPGGFAGPPAPQPGIFGGPPQPGGFAAAPPQPGVFGGPPAPQPAPFAPQFAPTPPQTPAQPAPGVAAPPPVPQPPGPPPGTLSGSAQSQPVPPAAQSGAAMPVAAPVAQPAVPATTGPQPTAEGGGVLDGKDLGAAIKQIYAGGWSVLAPVVVTAVAVVAAVMVPLGVLAQLMLRILPLGIASLLTMLLALAQFGAMIVLFPALTRFILGNHVGAPIAIQAAVQEQIAKIADVLVNCVVAAIPLGIFSGPIYFVEGKKLGEVVSRNFNLLGKELVPIIVAVFAGAVGLAIVQLVIGTILGYLPIGWLLASIFFNTVTSVVIAYGIALSTWLYFTVRRKHEGGDPEGEARARLSAAATALPAA